MKVLGQITPEYEESEEYGTIVTNGGYVGGSIIAFTETEVNILKMLQQAIAGEIYNLVEVGGVSVRPPKEGGIDKALWLVYQFVKARFAVNEFAHVVDQLENTLMRLDEGLRGELDEL